MSPWNSAWADLRPIYAVHVITWANRGLAKSKLMTSAYRAATGGKFGIRTLKKKEKKKKGEEEWP